MAKEGLAYCIRRRDFGPKPPGPTDDEILEDFLNYCLNGILDASGHPIEAPDASGQMISVINWLAQLGKFEANFYVARKPTLMFFVSLADGSNPWSELPGFMLLIKKGNLTLDLGKSGELISKGRFILEKNPKDLDNELAKRKPFLDKVSPKNKPRLIAALRGDKGTDLINVLSEVDAEENLGLSEVFR